MLVSSEEGGLFGNDKNRILRNRQLFIYFFVPQAFLYAFR